MTVQVAFAQVSDDRVVLKNNKIYVAPGTENLIEIVDGDTLWIGNHQIRLYGIDAVEPKQDCELDGKLRSYCHDEASNALRDFSQHPDFHCVFKVRDGENKPWVRYGRYVASCFAGDVDVNYEMVRRGWAVADENYGDSFRDAERQAREANSGIHATEFQNPKAWRKAQRDDDCDCSFNEIFKAMENVKCE